MPPPIVKLDFSRVGLCGRRDELEILADAFEGCLREPHCPTRTIGVLLEGDNGTGKTALVTEFQKSVGSSSRCFFCRGAFDKDTTSGENPFGGIVGCLTELVDNLVRDDARVWKTRIQDNKMAAECHFLARMVVRLRELIDWNNEYLHDDDEVPDDAGGFDFDRLRLSVHNFLKFVSSYHPVVFVVEDVHWAPCYCHQLMKAVSNNLSAGDDSFWTFSRYLFVWTFRSMDPELRGMLEDLENDEKMNLQNVRLSDLSLNHVGDMVQSLLRRDAEDVKRLAGAVHHKTGGNPFFCVQFLQTLEARKLIFYSMSSYRWEWDIERILGETDISDNVVDIVVDKINTLPRDAQLTLIRAASLGPSRFDLDTLLTAVQAILQARRGASGDENAEEEAKEGGKIGCVSELENLVEILVGEGLVEKLATPGSYKFSHDRIHEAARALLPDGECKERLHLAVGMQLRDRLLLALPEDKRGTIAEERLLLLVVHQLNLGRAGLLLEEDEEDKDKRVDLAALNVRAADLALKRLAFTAAMEYLLVASSALGSSSWLENYELMIELYTKMANTYRNMGKFAECEATIDALLENARSFQDKLTPYRILVKSLAHRAKFDEAFKVNFDVLDKLGIHFWSQLPPPRLQITQACVRLKWALRDKADEELLHLPECKDQGAIHQATFLSVLVHLSALSHREDYMVLGDLHLLLLTLKHGVLGSTGPSLAVYGRAHLASGKYDDAFRFGSIGLQVSQRFKNRFHRAVCLLLHHLYIHHWRKPFHESLEPLLMSYQIFAQSTDASFLYMDLAMAAYAKLYLCCGLRLSALEVDLRKFSEEMCEIRQECRLALFRPWWQLLLNLTGRSDEPRKLQGHAVATDQYSEVIAGEYLSEALHQCRMILAFILGDDDAMLELLDRRKKDNSLFPDVIMPQTLLIEGLYAFSMARSTGKGKFQRRAKSIVAKFARWVKGGAVNCHHMLKLLLAEQCRQENGDFDTVRAAFDDAISSAAKLGFVNNHALANERAAIYFLEHHDRSWARTYMTRCRQLYADWGASAKVARLEAQYEWCFEGSSVDQNGFGAGVKARSRLDELENERERRFGKLSLLGAGPRTTYVQSDPS